MVGVDINRKEILIDFWRQTWDEELVDDEAGHWTTQPWVHVERLTALLIAYLL